MRWSATTGWQLGVAPSGSMLILLAACSSGQTGSPAEEPPVYDSSAPMQPKNGDTGTTVDAPEVASSPVVLPDPSATPNRTCIVGGTLVVAGLGGLTLFDAESSLQVRGHWTISGSASLLRCSSLGRLVLIVTEAPSYSDAGIPDSPIPRVQRRLMEVDATDPAHPQPGRSFVLPTSAAAVVPVGDGYTVLGATIDSPQQACGSGATLGVAQVPSEVRDLWVQRYALRDGQFTQVSERRLAKGQWHLAKDEGYAVYLGNVADGGAEQPLDIELIDLTTLQTLFASSALPADLGSAPVAALGADYAEGILLLAGGSRVLGWETVTGRALGTVPIAEPASRITFLPGSDLASLLGGGQAMLRIDRTASPPQIARVDLPEGGVLPDRVLAPLTPFGDGFLQVGATGPAGSQHLLLTQYALNPAGTLERIDQLDTSLPYDGSQAYWVDSNLRRITYAAGAASGEAGQVAIVDASSGRFRASPLVPTAARTVAAADVAGDVLAIGKATVQPVRVVVPDAASLPELQPGASIVTALEDVRFQLELGGLYFTLHRTDTGATSLRVRQDPFGATTPVPLAHGADALVPVDASHLAVFGFSASAICNAAQPQPADREENAAPSCPPSPGNDVSVAVVQNGTAQVIATFPLDDAKGGGAPPEGVDQHNEWRGYFQYAPSRWAVVGSWTQTCHSDASCASIGADAYHSIVQSMSPGCAAGTDCRATTPPDQVITSEIVSGSRSETRLFLLNLDLPDQPDFTLVQGGAPNQFSQTEHWDISSQLLEYRREETVLRGYASLQPLYNEQGQSVVDRRGYGRVRYYLQVMDGISAGSLQFENRVNVPGLPVLLTRAIPSKGAAIDGVHTVFTVESAYRQTGEPYSLLHRLHVERGGAWIEQSLELGADVQAAAVGEDRIAILRTPESACVAGVSDLLVVDVAGSTMRASAALQFSQLAGHGWALSTALPSSATPGQVYVYGGPAGSRGRLVVDTNTDPPAIVRYETWNETFNGGS